MKYLITGGCGFIGGHLVATLVKFKPDIEFIILDQAGPELDSDLGSKVTYHQVDITQFEQIEPYFQGIEAVIHLAALAQTKTCMEYPLLCHSVNVTGTLNVLEACRRKQVNRVVVASSHTVLAGMHPLRMSKIAVENYCQLYQQLYQLPVICLRYGAIYGPNQRGNNVLNAFRQSLQKHGYVTIFGDGTQQRDFVHVEDCIRANLLALESEYQGIVDICSGRSYSLKQIASQILRAQIVYQPARSGDALNFNQSPELAKQVLGFETIIPLKKGYFSGSDLGLGDCLIGYSGFVGSNLTRSRSFDYYFNSQNIEQIKYRSFKSVYCCGLSGLVWYASQHPEEDYSHVEQLMTVLKTIHCSKFILISTINVYPQLRSDECSVKSNMPVDLEQLRQLGPNRTYGYHRLLFEQFIQAQFPSNIIIRLPALYGFQMKKGIIYDLLTRNYLEGHQLNDYYQFYSLLDLNDDIEKAKSLAEAGHSAIVNLFPAPLSVKQLIEQCSFPEVTLSERDSYLLVAGQKVTLKNNRPPKYYNVYCPQTELERYLYSNSSVIEKINQFLLAYHEQQQMIGQRLMISNIAWTPDQNKEILPLLQKHGLKYLEIAPTTIASWDQLATNRSLIEDFCHLLAQYELQIYSIQAITYQLPDLQLFGTYEQQLKLIEHILWLIDLFTPYGVKRIIFGCPQNRTNTEAERERHIDSVKIFKQLGDYADQHGMILVLETMAQQYGCNYINTIEQAVQVIEQVNSKGFRLHLDLGNLLAESEDLNQLTSNPKIKQYLQHVQLSELGLSNFNSLGTRINDHRQFAKQLKNINYTGKISIEMLSDQQLESNSATSTNITKALNVAKTIYF